MLSNLLVLGIESSCDETGVALVQVPLGKDEAPTLLADALYSQIEMHQAYGGVVPELASRDHIRRVLPLAQKVLNDSGRALQDVDVVAFTRALVWRVRCWWGQGWPALWGPRWLNRCWVCTIWRGICCPPF